MYRRLPGCLGIVGVAADYAVPRRWLPPSSWKACRWGGVGVVRSRKPVATRGLNRNCNRRMKDVFIGAATGGTQTEPYRSYLQGLEKKGIRKEMARLTLARKISSIALRIWKKGETFDPKKLNWTT